MTSTGLLHLLPPELRDQIYEYIVLKPRTTITMLTNHACVQSEVSAGQPALSYVNKQLRAETLPLFYSSNTFLAEVSDIYDLEIAKQWLAAIGDSNVRHLRRVALCGWTKMPCGERSRPLWIRAVLDLKAGTVELDRSAAAEMDECADVVKSEEEVRKAFGEIVEARKGVGFDVAGLGELMEGFHKMCVAY